MSAPSLPSAPQDGYYVGWSDKGREMADFWSWLPGSNDQEKFEILKILLEKGLLALIVAIAGWRFAISLERYKSALKKEQELSKIVVPQIVNMLEDAEALYEHGHQTIQALDKQVTSFGAWKDALIRSPARITAEGHYKFPDDFKRPIVEFNGETISIAELLERTAPDDLVRSVLHHPKFAVQRETSIQMEFLYVLYDALKTRPEARTEAWGSALSHMLLSSIFVPLVRAPRDEYHEKVDKFILAMMRRLPADNKKQTHAWDNIHTSLKGMREVIDQFPTRDLVKIEGLKSSYGQLAHHHADVLSQLRAILNAV
jgi:hypothetical protein